MVGVTGVSETLLEVETGSGGDSEKWGTGPALGSFLEEALGKRKTDFQEDWDRGELWDSGAPLAGFEKVNEGLSK